MPVLFPSSSFDLIVIGASAGGVAAIKSILRRLPISLPCSVAIVQHIPEVAYSELPKVLGSGSRVLTKFAQDEERLRAGTVYVAPPGFHLRVTKRRNLGLCGSDRVKYVRPAADVLFQSAAEALGPRLLALVLTGMGSDGAAGAQAVKENGGVVIVQDPASAEAPWMPLAASAACQAHLTLPLSTIPDALVSLCAVAGARDLFCDSPASRTDEAVRPTGTPPPQVDVQSRSA